MAIDKMSAENFQMNFAHDAKALSNVLDKKGTKVFLSSGIQGATYLEFKDDKGVAHHVRMSEVSKIVQNMAKAPKDVKSLENVFKKLIVLESNVDTKEASGLRLLFEKMRGTPYSKSQERLEGYRTGEGVMRGSAQMKERGAAEAAAAAKEAKGASITERQKGLHKGAMGEIRQRGEHKEGMRQVMGEMKAKVGEQAPTHKRDEATVLKRADAIFGKGFINKFLAPSVQYESRAQALTNLWMNMKIIGDAPIDTSETSLQGPMVENAVKQMLKGKINKDTFKFEAGPKGRKFVSAEAVSRKEREGNREQLQNEVIKLLSDVFGREFRAAPSYKTPLEQLQRMKERLTDAKELAKGLKLHISDADAKDHEKLLVNLGREKFEFLVGPEMMDKRGYAELVLDPAKIREFKSGPRLAANYDTNMAKLMHAHGGRKLDVPADLKAQLRTQLENASFDPNSVLVKDNKVTGFRGVEGKWGKFAEETPVTEDVFLKSVANAFVADSGKLFKTISDNSDKRELGRLKRNFEQNIASLRQFGNIPEGYKFRFGSVAGEVRAGEDSAKDLLKPGVKKGDFKIALSSNSYDGDIATITRTGKTVRQSRDDVFKEISSLSKEIFNTDLLAEIERMDEGDVRRGIGDHVNKHLEDLRDSLQELNTKRKEKGKYKIQATILDDKGQVIQDRGKISQHRREILMKLANGDVPNIIVDKKGDLHLEM